MRFIDQFHRRPKDVIQVTKDDDVKIALQEMGWLETIEKKRSLTPFGSLFATYSRHPTHWIMIAHFAGAADPSENGYLLVGFPRSDYSSRTQTERSFDMSLRRA